MPGFCKMHFVPGGLSKYVFQRKKERYQKGANKSKICSTSVTDDIVTIWQRLEEVQQDANTHYWYAIWQPGKPKNIKSSRK